MYSEFRRNQFELEEWIFEGKQEVLNIVMIDERLNFIQINFE